MLFPQAKGCKLVIPGTIKDIQFNETADNIEKEMEKLFFFSKRKNANMFLWDILIFYFVRLSFSLQASPSQLTPVFFLFLYPSLQNR